MGWRNSWNDRSQGRGYQGGGYGGYGGGRGGGRGGGGPPSQDFSGGRRGDMLSNFRNAMTD
eukprot:5708327-Alexandrium_andersonii.AAC.1